MNTKDIANVPLFFLYENGIKRTNRLDYSLNT